jgi:hypothetical protein
MLARESILEALEKALQPLDYVQAMWQGGAAAFNRLDEWSDLDLMVVTDDDHVLDAAGVIDKVLQALSPIEIRFEIPQPSWHGHWQAFYRLKEAGPFLIIDCLILKRSSTNLYLEREIHGDACVHFDKIGIVESTPFSVEEHLKQMQSRLETLRVMFDLFQYHTQKELNRGNAIEAFTFYQGYTVRLLVEALRMIHDPARYNFHTRYVYYNLPPDVVQRLERFFFVADAQQLAERFLEAQQFFHETVAQIDFGKIKQTLEGGI